MPQHAACTGRPHCESSMPAAGNRTAERPWNARGMYLLHHYTALRPGPLHMSVEITEGTTRLIVPGKSITDAVPPKRPAFFNPRARLSRDLSLAAYGAFLKDFAGPGIFLDGLSGVGARGLRVANELKLDSITVNDLNPSAMRMAGISAKLNGIANMEFSSTEACRFFSERSERGRRGSIIDIDPFGSPAPFLDCGLRAVMHGGMLSCTATDLQVLNGLFQDACRRRYGGIPARTTYGNETAIRLILGCMRSVAGRLGMKIVPLFVETNMHYYRTYVRVQSRPDLEENLGFVLHCFGCGRRRIAGHAEPRCRACNVENAVAGPLWTGALFDRMFVQDMAGMIPSLGLGRDCSGILEKAIQESEVPGAYYTTDEIAARTRSSPPRLGSLISVLRNRGHLASPTAFSPTGFRTDADMSEIEGCF